MVVDASALLPLVLSDTAERTDYAAAIVERAASDALELVIPQMCHFELAAVLSRKVRSRVVSNATAQEFFEQLDALGFELFVESFRYRAVRPSHGDELPGGRRDLPDTGARP